ncbi:MAG: hypothetical protein ACTSRH_02330 [Promethearchaeota archaeon]
MTGLSNIYECLDYSKGEASLCYNDFKDILNQTPFIGIIGKYDHVLGPRAVYSSIPLSNTTFIRNLLRDALNTKNKFVIINFGNFYSQIYKIEVKDPNARGGKQLYAIILIRDSNMPIIPIFQMRKIGMIFHKIENTMILKDDPKIFEDFYNKILEIYVNKDELLPLESAAIQIRTAVTTIQGFCEILIEQINKNKEIEPNELKYYLNLMRDSCKDIIESVEGLNLSGL